jgi:hypothetical protein
VESKIKSRLFVLYRTEDESGVSGIGDVAEGVEFSNGKCALCWKTQYRSVAIYDSIRELEAIHGHDGKTRVVWND